MDPQAISAMFSNEDVEDMWEEGDAREDEIDLLRSLADKLPDKYKNVYNLIYSRRLTQQEVATALDISQVAVVYYTKRIIEYLIWFKSYPTISESKIDENISRLKSIKHRELFREFCRCYNLREVADATGYQYITASSIILKSVRSGIFDEEFNDLIQYLKSYPRTYSGEKYGKNNKIQSNRQTD